MVAFIINIFKKTRFKRNMDLYIDNRCRTMINEMLEKNNWELMGHCKLDSFIKEIEDNVKFHFYLDSEFSRTIYFEKYESEEIEFIKKYLNKGDNFLDIGANIGLFTVIGSFCVGETGKVISFEPTPKTYERLNENIKLNNLKNVSTYKLALSNEKSKVMFSISQNGYDAWNSIAKPTFGGDYIQIEVDCTTLDDFMIEHLITDISLIKMDIEGWELFALKGGHELLSKHNSPDILIEFTEENAKNAGTTCNDVYQYLNSLGYSFYKYKKGELIPQPPKESYPYENLIATKNIEGVRKRIKNTLEGN